MNSLLKYLPLGDAIAAKKWSSVGLSVAIAVFLLLLPLVLGFDHRFVNIALFVAIFAVGALGLNIVVGSTGLLDLGYVMFLATGAVVTFNMLLLEKGELPNHVYQRVTIQMDGAVELEDGTRLDAADVVKQADGTRKLSTGQSIDNESYLISASGQRIPSKNSSVLIASDGSGWALPVGNAKSINGSHPFVFDMSLLFIMLIAGGLCAVLGILRGIPTLKLTGDYYAIVTLGIAEMVFLFYFNTRWLTGGANGMSLDSSSTPTLFGTELYYDSAAFYGLVMAVLALTVIMVDRLDRSRTGRAWAAIRLDETAARACGIDASKYKMIAFAISGFLGGISGSLYAIWLGTVAAKDLDVWMSVLVLCAVVLGGMGSIRGVLFGSLIFFPLREFLREEIPVLQVRVPPEASNLVYGLLLIFVMRFRPQGLLPRSKSSGETMDDAQRKAVQASQPRLFVMKDSREPSSPNS